MPPFQDANFSKKIPFLSGFSTFNIWASRKDGKDASKAQALSSSLTTRFSRRTKRSFSDRVWEFDR